MADVDKHNSTETIRPRFPKLASLTKDILYSNTVWNDPALNPRDRSLITLSVLVVLESPQLKTHLKRALDNKVKPEEIVELITHVAFYAGWPRAYSAALTTTNFLDARSRPHKRVNKRGSTRQRPSPDKSFSVIL